MNSIFQTGRIRVENQTKTRILSLCPETSTKKGKRRDIEREDENWEVAIIFVSPDGWRPRSPGFEERYKTVTEVYERNKTVNVTILPRK